MRDNRSYLNSFQLKMLAACAMLIDHTMHVFYPAELSLRCIGRLAFPIFAFLVAIGYSKTKNIKNYIIRMFVFALIAQVPYVFMIGTSGGIPFNVIFTLLFGLVSIYSLEKTHPIIGISVTLILAILAELGGFDHSAFGVLMVIAMYYTRDSIKLRSIASAVLILLFTTQYIIMAGFNSFIWIIIVFYLFAIPFVNLYNSRKGLSNSFSRWFFYAFYPIHITLLVVLDKVFPLIKG